MGSFILHLDSGNFEIYNSDDNSIFYVSGSGSDDTVEIYDSAGQSIFRASGGTLTISDDGGTILVDTNTDELIIHNNTSFTFSTTGAIGIDTDGDGSTVTQGVIEYYDGTNNMRAFGVDSYPSSDGDVMKYNAGNNALEWGTATVTLDQAYTASDNAGDDPSIDIDGSDLKITTSLGNFVTQLDSGAFYVNNSNQNTIFEVTGSGGDDTTTIYDDSANEILKSYSGELIIHNGTSFSPGETGSIYFDTDGDSTNVTQGVIQGYDGTQEMYFWATDAYPTTDGYALRYDSASTKLAWEEVTSDTAFASSWNTVTEVAPSKNAVYDAFKQKGVTFGSVTPGNDTIYITAHAAYPGQIDSVQNIATSSGTITAAVKINGTDVTNLSSISVSSTEQDVSATGANTFSTGDKITVVLSSNSSAADLRGTILITQTGPSP